MTSSTSFRVLALVAAARLLITGAVLAAAPKINYLFPAGAARGSTVTVTANGSFSNWPVHMWASEPGIEAEADKDKGKFKVTVSAAVSPGVHWLRFFDEEGASSPRPFIVGTIPELEELEPNDAPDAYQRVADRLTINGRLARNNDVDGFVVELRAGQTFVAAVAANNELGSPMDAVLQLCLLVPNRSAAKAGGWDAFVVEQIDDCVGLDPQVAMPVRQNGTYLVRVFSFPKEPNSTIGFAGGDNYIYRLTLTTGSFINIARPIAIQRGTSPVVELRGWNLRDDMKNLSLSVPPTANELVASHAEMASFARVAVVDFPILDYNSHAAEKPPIVTVPIVITGSFDKPRQRDSFVVEAKKGEKLRAQVASRILGFAADPALRITDQAGKILAENDDGGSRRTRRLDPDLDFTIPEDGQYHIVVRDIHGQTSDRHVYRLTIDRAAADFELSIGADAFHVDAGKTLEVPVTIERQDGFGETIQFTVEGLPPGITSAPVTSEKEGSSAKSVKVVITAAADATEWQGPITISGTTSGDRPLKRTANYKLADLDRERSDVWLNVRLKKDPK